MTQQVSDARKRHEAHCAPPGQRKTVYTIPGLIVGSIENLGDSNDIKLMVRDRSTEQWRPPEAGDAALLPYASQLTRLQASTWCRYQGASEALRHFLRELKAEQDRGVRLERDLEAALDEIDELKRRYEPAVPLIGMDNVA